jgi:hypothetical protein
VHAVVGNFDAECSSLHSRADLPITKLGTDGALATRAQSAIEDL